MALIFMDSFDYADSETALLRKWDTSSVSTVLTTSGRRGGGAASVVIHLEKSLPANPTYFFGFAYKNPAGSVGTLLSLREGSIVHLDVNFNATGAVWVTRGGVTLGTPAPSGTVRVGTYYYIELSATIHDTTGAFDLRVNEATVSSATGVDTRNAGAVGTIDNFRLGAANAYYDDLYVLDDTGAAPRNTFLGDVQIEVMLPDADGALTQFDTTFPASPTTHFDKVDEVNPDLETSYNETPTAADRDSFTMSNLPAITGGDTVLGIQVSTTARKTTSGTQNLQNFVRLSATNYDGGSVSLTEDYKEYLDIYNTDPDAPGEWTTAILDGIEAGTQAV